MDTITHGIVGALAGKALFAGRDVPARPAGGAFTSAQSSPTARVAIIACTVSAVFPDIDIFAGPLMRNPLAIMEWHRNITHSLIMLPIWAALLAGVSLVLARWLDWKSPSFVALYAVCATGLATHVFLDLVTSFGTMVWSPLNYSRLSWDWIFIVDLTVTSLALVPQLAAWCYRDPSKFLIRAALVWAGLTVGAFGAYEWAAVAGYGFALKVVGVASALAALVLFAPAIRNAGFHWNRAAWCRGGLALVGLYIACAAFMHGKALATVNDFARAQHLPTEHLAAAPLPPTLTHWVGLIGTPEGVWRTTFREPGGAVEHTDFYADQQFDRYAEQARMLKDVQVYLWFSRFPVWQVNQQGTQTVVDITDVRFFRGERSIANAETGEPRRPTEFRTGPGGNFFEVVFDSSGRVISHGLKRPRPQ